MRQLATVTLALVLVLTAGCGNVDTTPEASTDSASPTSGTPTPASVDGEPTAGTTDGSPGDRTSPVRSDSNTSSPAGSPTPSATSTDAAESLTVEVTRVVDGDTLKIRYANGSEDTVRMLGVDTPEVHAENTPDEWEGVPNTRAGEECLRAAGHDASDHVKQRLDGETVRLTFDENEGRRGFYGRLLAYVYLDDRHVNYRLVELGHGRVYDSSFEKRDRFYAAESDAQNREVGAWDCRNVESATATATPADSGGAGDGSLAVVEVHEDAEGNDHENENDEYVVFENGGDSTLDVSGWTVSDEADHTYYVPQGVTLDPGDRVTLYTGGGQDTESELYWGSDSAIWNNGGDTVYVRDDGGSTRVEHSYSG